MNYDGMIMIVMRHTTAFVGVLAGIVVNSTMRRAMGVFGGEVMRRGCSYSTVIYIAALNVRLPRHAPRLIISTILCVSPSFVSFTLHAVHDNHITPPSPPYNLYIYFRPCQRPAHPNKRLTQYPKPTKPHHLVITPHYPPFSHPRFISLSSSSSPSTSSSTPTARQAN